MLRSGDNIRLTQKERENFDIIGGKGLPAPKTVTEHNNRLQAAADYWKEGDSPEEKLAAALAEDMKIAE